MKKMAGEGERGKFLRVVLRRVGMRSRSWSGGVA